MRLGGIFSARESFQEKTNFSPVRVDSKGKEPQECVSSRSGRGGFLMASKKKDVYVMPRKLYWHLYSLQNLNSEKFIKVVNKILRKEYQLIK